MRPIADGVLAVYNAQICVWVEDPETKAYLDALWADGRIRTLVGGGAKAIAGLAGSAWEEGYQHVFALRDRDFGAPAMPPASTGPVFVVPKHENENYLLDESAIADCAYNTRGADAAAIAAEAAKTAAALVPWMASRRVLRDLWLATAGGFPADPRPADVPDPASATRWLTTRTGGLGVPPAEVQALVASALPKHLASCSAQVASGAWRDEFSGKEIFAPLVQLAWHKRDKHVGGAGARAMVAADIGRLQRARGTAPRELSELRLFLLEQIGLRP